MRFIIMHATSPRWEAGEIPSRELIGNVGALIGKLAKRGAYEGGEGLRATSEGARLEFGGGAPAVTPGPFPGGNELASGFSVVRTHTLDEAAAWATRAAEALGPDEVVEMDVRPVNEPWHIGLRPPPADLSTQRYMVVRKATAATESGSSSSTRRASFLRLIEETSRGGVHLLTEEMGPSRRGRRYVNTRDGVTIYDGPFVESKELLAGYMIVNAPSLDEAGRWAEKYLQVVESDLVDVRELA